MSDKHCEYRLLDLLEDAPGARVGIDDVDEPA